LNKKKYLNLKLVFVVNPRADKMSDLSTVALLAVNFSASHNMRYSPYYATIAGCFLLWILALLRISPKQTLACLGLFSTYAAVAVALLLDPAAGAVLQTVPSFMLSGISDFEDVSGPKLEHLNLYLRRRGYVNLHSGYVFLDAIFRRVHGWSESGKSSAGTDKDNVTGTGENKDTNINGNSDNDFSDNEFLPGPIFLAYFIGWLLLVLGSFAFYLLICGGLKAKYGRYAVKENTETNLQNTPSLLSKFSSRCGEILYGPKLPARLAWVLQESPSVLVPLLYLGVKLTTPSREVSVANSNFSSQHAGEKITMEVADIETPALRLRDIIRLPESTNASTSPSAESNPADSNPADSSDFFTRQWKLLQKLILFNLFVFHYINRVIVYPLMIRGGKSTPVLIMLFAFLFCLLNGFMQSVSLLESGFDNHAEAHAVPPPWTSDLMFFAGKLVMVRVFGRFGIA
jgi:hypothetical protein